MTADTPRMVIVPAKVTKAMVAAWDDSKPINGKYRSAHCAQGELAAMAAASPNAGKISRADLENAAARSYCECINRYKAWENLPVHTQDNWRTSIAAAIRALGLEIAEEGDKGDD